MEDGQRKDLPLDSPLDTKSSDMLVPVDQPKFAHNRQQYQGHVLPTSLRFEHNGWAAGEQVYEFEFEGGRIPETANPVKVEMSRTRLNGNPAYILNVYQKDGDEKLVQIYFNFSTGGNCLDIPDLEIVQPETGDRSEVTFSGTFNDKSFSFKYNVVTGLISDVTSGFSVAIGAQHSGIITFILTDVTDSVTVDTEGTGSGKVIIPSKLYNTDGNFTLGNVTSVEYEYDEVAGKGKHTVSIDSGKFTIENIDLNSNSADNVIVESADTNVKNISSPAIAEDTSLPVTFSFDKDVSNSAQVTGSYTNKLLYIKDLSINPEYTTTISDGSPSTDATIKYLNRLNTSFVDRYFTGNFNNNPVSTKMSNDIITSIPYIWDKKEIPGSPLEVGTKKNFYSQLNSSIVDVEVPVFFGTNVAIKDALNNLTVKEIDSSSLTRDFDTSSLGSVRTTLAGQSGTFIKVINSETGEDLTSSFATSDFWIHFGIIERPTFFDASLMCNGTNSNINTYAKKSENSPIYYVDNGSGGSLDISDYAKYDVWYGNKNISDKFKIDATRSITISFKLNLVWRFNGGTFGSYHFTVPPILITTAHNIEYTISESDIAFYNDAVKISSLTEEQCSTTFKIIFNEVINSAIFKTIKPISDPGPARPIVTVTNLGSVKLVDAYLTYASVNYPVNGENVNSVSLMYNDKSSRCLLQKDNYPFKIDINTSSTGLTAYSSMISKYSYVTYTPKLTDNSIVPESYDGVFVSTCLFKGHILKRLELSDSINDTITNNDIKLLNLTEDELLLEADKNNAYINFSNTYLNSYSLLDLSVYNVSISDNKVEIQFITVSYINNSLFLFNVVDGKEEEETISGKQFIPAKYIFNDDEYALTLYSGTAGSTFGIVPDSDISAMFINNSYTVLMSGTKMYQMVVSLTGTSVQVKYADAQSYYIENNISNIDHRYFNEVIPLLQDSYNSPEQTIQLEDSFITYYTSSRSNTITQDIVIDKLSTLSSTIIPEDIDSTDIEVKAKLYSVVGNDNFVKYLSLNDEDLFDAYTSILNGETYFKKILCDFFAGYTSDWNYKTSYTIMGHSVIFLAHTGDYKYPEADTKYFPSNAGNIYRTDILCDVDSGTPDYERLTLYEFYVKYLRDEESWDFTNILPLMFFMLFDSGTAYDGSEPASTFIRWLDTNYGNTWLVGFPYIEHTSFRMFNYSTEGTKAEDLCNYISRYITYINAFGTSISLDAFNFDGLIPDGTANAGATTNTVPLYVSEVYADIDDKYNIKNTVSLDSNNIPVFTLSTTLNYDAAVVVPRITNGTTDEGKLKLLTWDNGIFTFTGVHNNVDYTVTYNQSTQEIILYYNTYTLPVTGNNLQLPTLSDNTYLKDVLGLSSIIYKDKVLDYIKFTRGIDTSIFAKMYGPYNIIGDATLLSINNNNLTFDYTGVPEIVQGEHTFDLSQFNLEENNTYLQCYVTDVNNPESYRNKDDPLSPRKHIGKIDAKEEYQIIKQAWNTTTAVENYWWIAENKILYLTKDALILMEKTDVLDDWNGDKWEQIAEWDRATYLPSTVVQYGVTSVNGTEVTGAKFWTLTPYADDSFTFKVYTLLDSLSTPLPVFSVQEYTFNLIKKDITKTSDILNTDYNNNNLYSYSGINVYDMCVNAHISTSIISKNNNRFMIIGIHLDTNFNQWAVLIDLNSPATTKIIQGYGFVGVDGSLTGGEIPDKYFSVDSNGGGFNSRVLDTGILTSEASEITNPSALSQFESRIVGNENQQWYIDKDIDGIVSHLTFDASTGMFSKVVLPIHNNYAYCYESPSFMTRVAGDVSIQMKPLLSLMPVNSKQNQWIWNLLFGYIGAPLMYYINPKISYVNYLQQTFGQYAYVHYNSTALYQSKDLQKKDIVSPLESASTEVEAAVTKDELSFDVCTISQTQDCGSSPWEELFYLLGTSLTTALDYTKEKLKVNEQQNQSATSDKGNKYSQMFLKNLESMSKAAFTSRSYTPTLVSEVTMVKTLDMFYSTSAKQHVYAGPGFVNHNFVAQCVAQSAVNTQLEGNQLSILAIFTPLTTFQMKLEVEVLKKTASYLNELVQSWGGPLWSFAGTAGAGFSFSAIVASALALVEKGVELSYHAIEVAIPAVEHILNSLGGNHLTSTITNTLSNHNVELEAKHRYGSNSEVFMWPCFDCKDNIFVREKVIADTISKPWNLSMNPVSKFIPPTAAATANKIVKQLNKYTGGWVNLNSDSTPATNTIKPNALVANIAYGSVDYRIAVCRGEIEDAILPEGMACVIGSDNFLPSDNFKNENIGESEPVFATPVIQDYAISKDWKLAMTCTAGEIAWVSCKDTKLIDGAPSNVIISDDFCGIASPYTAIELKRELSVEYLRPWAVTPNVLALNITGLNTAFERKMYHAFDGYGYRIISWYGAPGMNKEKYNLLYNFQINDRFKRSNKLPPNQFLGNFKSEPDTGIQSLDRVFNQVMVPSENEGMDAGTVGEDKAVVRYSLPIFSEFVSTLPAIVKTLSSYKLAVVDGVTSLCTDLRNTQSAYKTSVSTDFNIASKQYRVTNDYICSVDNTSGVTVLQELVATLGLTYLGATLTEAYFYSPATRKYYSYTGGANLHAVDMLERFRDIKNGVWDFVNHEVAMPCLATFDRLDSNVSDDEDETDNIIIPMIKGNEFIGEVSPPITTIFNTDSWFRTLSLPSGLTFQGPNRCIINRFIYMEYMNKGIKSNRGRWKRVPKEVYHPFRKYKEEYQEVTNYVNDTDNDNVKGWTHNPFLLVTSPLGLNEETDCLFEWEVTFAWTVEMDRIYAQDEYVCVNLMSETMTPGGKVYNRPTHIYLTKELFTRTGNYGYYSFRYEGNNGIGNRERLHIWSDGYIAVSSVQVEYKPMTSKRQTKLTQYADIQQLNEF